MSLEQPVIVHPRCIHINRCLTREVLNLKGLKHLMAACHPFIDSVTLSSLSSKEYAASRQNLTLDAQIGRNSISMSENGQTRDCDHG